MHKESERKASIVTQATVANITEVVFNIMSEVSGNDISTTINGSKTSREVIAGLVHNKIKTKLS